VCDRRQSPATGTAAPSSRRAVGLTMPTVEMGAVSRIRLLIRKAVRLLIKKAIRLDFDNCRLLIAVGRRASGVENARFCAQIRFWYSASHPFR
jgi:hypothetical protein